MNSPMPSFNRADGFENIVGLLILMLWGVGRVLMSRSKRAPPPSPATPPSEVQGPDEELRRFLEELAQGAPAVPAAPPPVPPPVRASPTPTRPRETMPADDAMRSRSLPERAPVPPRLAPRHGRRPAVMPPPPLARANAVGQEHVVSATRPRPAMATAVAADTAPLTVAILSAAPRAVLPTQSFGGMTTLRGAVTHRTSPNARRIRQWLSSSRTRRDAIVLAEVLGPPRALSDH